MVLRMRFLAVTVGVCLAAGVCCAEGAKTAPAAGTGAAMTATAIDQRALDTLKLMCDTLGAAKTMSFRARSLVPIKGPSGIWVSLFGDSRVVVQGPDKLFAETRGDFFPYDFYFDGTTVTAYAPTKNVYATKEEPGTVDALIRKAYREEGRSFPYADILVAQSYAVLTEGLVNAVYVGETTLATGKTKHLAFINKNVEWQIWIGADDHLPRFVNATYLDDTAEPSYAVEFFDWKIGETVPDGTFTFKNASQAAKVDFKSPKVSEEAAAI